MILEAIYNGDFYPSETVVPKSEKYRNALRACEKIMDQLAQRLTKEDYDLVETLLDQSSIAQCEVQKSDAERHLHGVLATLSRCKATSQGNSSIMVTRTIYVRLIIIHGGKNGKLQRNSLPIVTEPEPAANP